MPAWRCDPLRQRLAQASNVGEPVAAAPADDLHAGLHPLTRSTHELRRCNPVIDRPVTDGRHIIPPLGVWIGPDGPLPLLESDLKGGGGIVHTRVENAQHRAA